MNLQQNNLSYTARMLDILHKAFVGAHIVLRDDSNSHYGHSGAHPSGETHFHLIIISDQFIGKSRIDRQRHVYGLLAQEMREHVHALSLELKSPRE
jgi:BolA protein